MKTVIENTRALLKKSGMKGAIDLQREAQNDMVLPFAKVGKPGEAIRFFKQWAGDRFLKLCSRLASVYTEETEYRKSTKLLKMLIVEAKKTTDQKHMVLTFQRQIVENSHRSGDKAATSRTVSALSPLR